MPSIVPGVPSGSPSPYVTAADGDASYLRGISVTDPSYGATGDGSTDDSAAIRLAIAAASAAGADLYFPEGTYVVSRDGSNSYALAHPGGRWYGPGVIKLKASQSSSVVVVWTTGAGAVLDGLTIDGNGANQGASSDQRHGVRVATTDCVLRNVTIDGCDGDGVAIYTGGDRCSVRGCVITDNLRNGVTVDGGADYVEISHNTITGNSTTAVDVEVVSGQGHADYGRIIGNYLSGTSSAYAVAVAGPDTSNLCDGWVVADNIITGCLYLVASSNTRVTGNTITAAGTSNPAVEASTSTGTLIAGNRIVKTDGITAAVECSYKNSYTPTRVTVTDNHITSAYYGILIRGASRVSITNNTVEASTAANAGIYVQATVSMVGVTIHGNIIRDFLTNAVQVLTYLTETITGLSVRGNVYIDSGGATMTRGLRLEGTASQITEVHYGGNLLSGVSTRVSDNTSGGPVTTTTG